MEAARRRVRASISVGFFGCCASAACGAKITVGVRVRGAPWVGPFLMRGLYLYPAFAALAYAGSTCLNNGGADGSNICFTWAVDSAAGTITINAECTPPTFPPPVVGPVTWCAIGLNKGQTNKMFQSNIWVFGPTPGGPAGSAFVGDHLSIVRPRRPAHPYQLHV